MKKNETRHCPKCQTKTRLRGDKTKEIVTSAGKIKLERQYTECLPCRSLGHVADVRLGLDGRYTVGLRRLAVKAGTMCRMQSAEYRVQSAECKDEKHFALEWDAAALEFAKRDEVLDVYHGLENISHCGKVLYGAETKAYKTWQDETMLELLWNGYELIEKRLDKLEKDLQTAEDNEAHSAKQGIEVVSKQTTRKSSKQGTEVVSKQTIQKSSELEAIRKLRGYLSYHAERLHYRERLAEGRSIGSGQVEGACKNLIGKRLKQTGAKWRVRRVNNMATLCAILYGNQWKTYWNYAK